MKKAQFLRPTKPPVKPTENQNSIFDPNDEKELVGPQHDKLIIRPPVMIRTKESRTKVINQMTASFIISPVKPTPEGAHHGVRSNAYTHQEAVDGHRRANFEAEGSSFKPLVNHHQRLYKGIG